MSPQRPAGYPRLAGLMGKREGIVIFNRFAELNAKNLLYRQAELMVLEQQLKDLEENDSIISPTDKDDRRPHFRHDAEELMNAVDSNQNNNAQWAKVLEIRQKVEEYNKLLLTLAQIDRLPDPNKYDLKFLRTWLEHPLGGEEALWGIDGDVWAKDSTELVALSLRKTADDLFTKWFAEKFIWWLDRRRALLVFYLKRIFANSKRSKAGDADDPVIRRLQDNRLNKFTGWVTFSVATALPSASIFALFYIKKAIWRLVFVLLFSAAFSVCLAIFTPASKLEIFSASTAMAAVQVVFIGQGLQQGNSTFVIGQTG